MAPNDLVNCKEIHLDEYLTGCTLLHSDICSKIVSSSHCCSDDCTRQFVAVGRRVEFRLVVILLDITDSGE